MSAPVSPLATILKSFTFAPIKKEEDINAVDEHNCTQLYYFIRDHSDDVDGIRARLKSGASPYVGESPFLLIRNNVPLILILLGAEHVPALQRCRDLHEVSDLLFPPIKTLDASTMAEVGTQLRSPREYSRFEARTRSMTAPTCDFRKIMASIAKETTKSKTAETLDQTCRRAKLDVVQRALIKDHPILNEAWRCANHPPATLHLVKNPNVRTGFGYNFKKHVIELGNFDSFEKLVFRLVYGILFALQSKTINDLASTPTQREYYAIFRLFLHHETDRRARYICSSFFENKEPDPKEFFEEWKLINSDPAHPNFAITQSIRLSWDEFYFHTFFQFDTDYLSQRLKELSELT
ncbi:MAG TPA: hypothetical protein VLG44_03060 [Chlamydiales bacterium]|nr:hypothetical protein [Chlamydiales bacterium]